MIASVPLARGIRITLLRPVQREALDDAMIVALASAVLPSQLDSNGVRRAATEFQDWVRGYLPNAERNHAYGSARLSNTGADPSPRWATQLRALETDARAAHGRAFVALSAEERRTIVRAQLQRSNATTLPTTTAGAQHVAVALLASFYSSPDATDLCYQARIQKNACRPLATSSQRPLPLAGGGAGGGAEP